MKKSKELFSVQYLYLNNYAFNYTTTQNNDGSDQYTNKRTQPLLEHNESRAVLGWCSWVIFGQSRSCVRIEFLLLGRQRRAFRVVDLGPTEVPVAWTLNLPVVQHALVKDTLSLAATKIKHNKYDKSTLDIPLQSHGLLFKM